MPVSIIIPALNESENLKAFLPKILEQKHSEFEVIIVNDGSTDDTKNYYRTFHDERLRVLNLSKQAGKKAALTEGIEHARYQNILLTDADCFPSSNQWIQGVEKALKEYEVVVGISQYKNKGSFLQEMIQFDTLFTVLQMDVAKALLGKPHMAVGRNIAFRKQVFKAVDGYSGHKHIPYGDDDLFINSLKQKTSITLLSDLQYQTVSVPKKSWSGWFQQKRRHLSAGTHYKGKNLWFAMLFQQGWLLTGLIFLGAFFFGKLLFLAMLNIKLLLWGYLWYCQRKYSFKIKPVFIPFYELFFTIYFLVVGISVIFAKKHEWT